MFLLLRHEHEHTFGDLLVAEALVNTVVGRYDAEGRAAELVDAGFHDARRRTEDRPGPFDACRDVVIGDRIGEHRVRNRKIVAVTACLPGRARGVARNAHDRRRRRACDDSVGQRLGCLRRGDARLFVLRHEQADVARAHRRDRVQRDGDEEHQCDYEYRAALFTFQRIAVVSHGQKPIMFMVRMFWIATLVENTRRWKLSFGTKSGELLIE